MKARKIVTFVTAFTLTANALMAFPAVFAADDAAIEETAEAMEPVVAAEENVAAAEIVDTEGQEETADATYAPEGAEDTAAEVIQTYPATTAALYTDMTTTASTRRIADATAANPYPTFTTARYTTTTYAPRKQNNEVRIIVDAVLDVPYSYLLNPHLTPGVTPAETVAEVPAVTTAQAPAVTTAEPAEETTSATQTSETTATTETTAAASKGLSGQLTRTDDTCRFTMRYDGESFVAKRDSIRYAPFEDSEHHLRFTADTWVTDVPPTCQDTSTNEILPITEVDITNSWWFKITLGEVSIPAGMKIIYNGDVISFEKAAELLLPVGNTLVISDSTSAGASSPSISEGGIVNAMAGEWFYEDETTATTATTVATYAYTEAAMVVPEVYYGLPEGLNYYPESSELYGVPRETGTFIFTVPVHPIDENGIMQDAVNYTYELTIKENTNLNVYSESDPGYSILKPIGTDHGNYDFVLDAPVESVYRSQGEFGQFVDLWLNGKRLVPGVDYDAVSGSTVMTIYEQTLANPELTNQNGNNTIAAEFRITDPDRLNDANDTNPLRVTAQNFRFPNAMPDTPAASPSPSVQNGKPNPHVEAVPVKLVDIVPASQNSASGTTTTTTVSNTALASTASTGDARPYWLYVSAAVAGLLGIFMTFPRRKTKTGEEQ